MSSTIPRTSGIYKIVCHSTGKFYVGSAVNLWKRWLRHRSCLRGNYHSNKYLQNAWNKYGEPAFEFIVVELILAPFMLEREQYYLDKLRPYDRKVGFNVLSVAGATFGAILSDEARQRISTSIKGQKRSAAAIQNMRDAQKKWTRRPTGPQSPEICARKSARLKGTDVHPNTRLANTEAASRWYVVTFPDGAEVTVKNLAQFCRNEGLTYCCMLDVTKGRSKQHRGYLCRFLEQGNGIPEVCFR